MALNALSLHRPVLYIPEEITLDVDSLMVFLNAMDNGVWLAPAKALSIVSNVGEKWPVP